jgi:succinate dehydrogenase / fumarate reductase flavoprotein subunit
MEEALARLDKLKARARAVSVEGTRRYNSGWHLALDLHNMLIASECVARRRAHATGEPRRHTRDDFPAMSASGARSTSCAGSSTGGSTASGLREVRVDQQPLPSVPTELLTLFDRSELSKYMTEDELAAVPAKEA